MKTTFVIKACACALCCLCACTSTHDKNANTISLEVDYNEMADFVSTRNILIPEDMEVVRLCNDSVSIGLVKAFKTTGERFYILNETSSAIYVFGNDGELKSTINRYGNAGNEYSDITDFCVSDSDIYILDQNKQKIHHLLTDGRYIEHIDISSIWGNQIFSVDNTLYIVNNASDTDYGKYHLFKIGKDKIEPFLPFSTAAGLYMIKSHAGKYVFTREDNTLYEIEDGSPKEILTLDFGMYSLPDFLKGADAMQLLRDGAPDKYALGVERIETDGERVFLYCDVKSVPKVIVYDSNRNEIVEFCSGFKNDIFLNIGLMRYSIYGKNLYDFYYADELSVILENLDETTLSEGDKKFKRQLQSELSYDDNPVIFKYRMQ